jgi:hypothetical protein
MNDKDIEGLIKSVDREVSPPQGLKDAIFSRIMLQKGCGASAFMNNIERMMFERPLWAACALSIVISGILWAVTGNDYINTMPDIFN